MNYFIKNIADIHSSTGASLPTTLLTFASYRLDFLKYSKDEVRNLVSSLKPKSYSMDLIPLFILHEFLDDLLPLITAMCN